MARWRWRRRRARERVACVRKLSARKNALMCWKQRLDEQADEAARRALPCAKSGALWLAVVGHCCFPYQERWLWLLPAVREDDE